MNNKRSWLGCQIGSQGLQTSNEEVPVKVEQERPRKKVKVTAALRRQNEELREENEKLKKEVEELKKVISAFIDVISASKEVISASKDVNELLKRANYVDREILKQFFHISY